MKRFVATLVSLAVLTLPAIASAHYPYESTARSVSRTWLQNSYYCPYSCDSFYYSEGWTLGIHSRQIGINYRKIDWSFATHYCFIETRVQQDGGPYVAQVYTQYCN